MKGHNTRRLGGCEVLGRTHTICVCSSMQAPSLVLRSHQRGVHPRHRHRGSTAAKSHAPTAVSAPTPLSPARDSQPTRNIVLAIDTDAAGSFKALQYTLQHIYRPGDVLHLLHVVPASTNLLPQGQCLACTMPPEEGLQEEMADRARQYFEQRYMQVATESGATVQLDLVHGSCKTTVTNTICQKVQDLAAELVVLTVQRKRSFIEDLFQAPVSKQVAEACPCPTLIIPDAYR